MRVAVDVGVTDPQRGRSGVVPWTAPGAWGGAYESWPAPRPPRARGTRVPDGVVGVVAAVFGGLAALVVVLVAGVGLVVVTGGAIVPAIVAGAAFALLVKPRHPRSDRGRAQPDRRPEQHDVAPPPKKMKF